jgi:hypothetical protein
MAMSDCVKECLWLRLFLNELFIEQVGATVIFEDNQGAIALAENTGYQSRTKHIDIRYHFLREKVRDQVIQLQYCDTKEMLADFLTKSLSSKTLQYLLRKINLVCTHQRASGGVENPRLCTHTSAY